MESPPIFTDGRIVSSTGKHRDKGRCSDRLRGVSLALDPADPIAGAPESIWAANELEQSLAENNIDLVYCAGPLSRALWEALPPNRRGGYAETAAALEPAVIGAVRAGDALMVKASNGSKMGPLVKALERQFPRRGALAPAVG